MPGFPATPLAPPVSGPLLWPWSRRGAGGASLSVPEGAAVPPCSHAEGHHGPPSVPTPVPPLRWGRCGHTFPQDRGDSGVSAGNVPGPHRQPQPHELLCPSPR